MSVPADGPGASPGAPEGSRRGHSPRRGVLVGAILLLAALLVCGGAGTIAALLSSTFVVHDEEVVVVTRRSIEPRPFSTWPEHAERAIDRPGLYTKLPFINRVHRRPGGPQELRLHTESYLLLDRRRVSIAPTARWFPGWRSA